MVAHEFQQFLDSLQARLRLQINPGIILSMNGKLLDVNSTEPLDQETLSFVHEVLNMELDVYRQTNKQHIDEILREENERREMLQREREAERKIIEREQLEKRRKENEERELKRRERAAAILKENEVILHKMVNPFGTLEIYNDAFAIYPYTVEKDIDPFLLYMLTKKVENRLAKCSLVYECRWDHRHVPTCKALRKYVNDKRMIKENMMHYCIKNDYLGLYEYVKDVTIKDQGTYKAFRLTDTTLIAGRYLVKLTEPGRNNNDETWCKTKFIIKKPTSSYRNLKKRGNYAEIDPEIACKIYRRYNALEKMKKNAKFMNGFRRSVEELWKPDGVMCRKGWEECCVTMSEAGYTNYKSL